MSWLFLFSTKRRCSKTLLLVPLQILQSLLRVKEASTASIHPRQAQQKGLLLSLGFRAGIGTAIEVEDKVGAKKNVGKGAEVHIDTGKHEDEAGIKRDRDSERGRRKICNFP